MKYRFAIEIETLHGQNLSGPEALAFLEALLDNGLRSMGHSRETTIGLQVQGLRLRDKTSTKAPSPKPVVLKGDLRP